MKIGLLAGNGSLPQEVITSCKAQGHALFAIAFEGQTSPTLVEDVPHAWFPLGKVSAILSALKKEAVTHVVLAGGIRRPSWSELQLDWKGVQWIAQMKLNIQGDDGILTAVTHLLEKEGFCVLPAHTFVENLLTPEGLLGLHEPASHHMKDIERGVGVLQALSSVDVGQAVVVQEGLVIGVEAIEGTEALLQRCGPLQRKGRGGVLIKMAKTHQNTLVDLPTIGPDTIKQATKAGLAGIALEAGASQILQMATVIKAADESGLFLLGIKRGT